jgi:hypothetical protein
LAAVQSKKQERCRAKFNRLGLICLWMILCRPPPSLVHETTDEFLLLRKPVIKSVVATDIADKQLGACRKARWAKAFEIDKNTDVITIRMPEGTITIARLRLSSSTDSSFRCRPHDAALGIGTGGRAARNVPSF